MMYTKTLIIPFCLLTFGHMNASVPLDSVYNKLKVTEGVTNKNVKYTGSFQEDMPGFIFQRGLGNGWTSGNRLIYTNIDQKDAESIFNVFDNAVNEVGFVIQKEFERACLDEKNKIGYACYYDKDNNSLYFLKASVEDEICIPRDWYYRDFYDGTTKNLQKQSLAVEWISALANLRSELKYNYVFYDRVKSKLDSAYNVILPLMENVKDDYEGKHLLDKYVAFCNDGHTLVNNYVVMERPVHSPFTTKFINDRVYVDWVESTLLDSLGMKRGLEIIAVNGIPVKEYADAELKPFVSSSTPQWTEYMVFDEYGLSTGREGTPLNLTLTDGIKIFKIEHRIGNGKRDIPRPDDNEIKFDKIEGNIGLLRIPDFQNSSVLNKFDSIYNDILNTDGLIIDIRKNEGGNDDNAYHIVRHFTPDSINGPSWRSPTYIPALASWGQKANWYVGTSELITPIEDKTIYSKPVVILIDHGTFSAAEDFVALFKGLNNVTLVGTPTAGSTGNGVRVKLNNLVMANICSKHDKAPDGREFVGIGIMPDVYVNETPESYFQSERDDYLKTALEVINKQLK